MRPQSIESDPIDSVDYEIATLGESMKVGKDCVVIGNVPKNIHVGDGSVVIGATDLRGNTIINRPMAVGRGANAGAGSIAIGAYACASVAQTELQTALQQFADLVVTQNNIALAQKFEILKSELQKPMSNRGAILTAWEGVKALATFDGAHNLINKISVGFYSLFQ